MIHQGQSREELRQVWLTSWRRHQSGDLLSPLEAQLAELIAQHPEYHDWLARGAAALASDAATDNPFLHLSLHLALREQRSTDRPPGIRAALEYLAGRSASTHAGEHRAMTVLGQVLWDAQRSGRAPDVENYLDQIRRL